LKEVENWRGINLLNVEWKIFTKLADEWIRAEFRAKGIIGEEQIGFIGGRWIHRNILLTQAVLQGGEEECGCLFLDLKNAYPSVRFTWMVDQLEKWWGRTGTAMGRILLGGWARTCLDGMVGESFLMEKGVKQGDIVAPMLFNIAMQPFLVEIGSLPWRDVRSSGSGAVAKKALKARIIDQEVNWLVWLLHCFGRSAFN